MKSGNQTAAGLFHSVEFLRSISWRRNRQAVGMPFRCHSSSRFLSALVLLAFACSSANAQVTELAQQAKQVLEKHCYQCHGKNGVATAGLNVLKWNQITGEGGVVKKKDPDSSLLYEYMESGVMPPEDDQRVKELPTASEMAMVKKWIKAGAPNFEKKEERRFISPEEVLSRIKTDIEGLRGDTHSIRYFTLTHLYNAGIREDELITYRNGLSKLLNSLSWHETISIPKPIDPEYTIWRIDLRDYRWDKREDKTRPDVWDAIVAKSPYNIKSSSETGKYIYRKLQHEIPFVRADWFVTAASRPPLYHEILEIPEKDTELENRLGIDVAANIKQGNIVRAGFTSSGVSDNNRLIERHETRYGAYWKSYDFAGNQGRQLLTEFPLGPGNDEGSFRHDGGEIIFNLPNGLQAYMLVAHDGKRIDQGPTSIVKDPDDAARAGGAVVNGISCMHCHDQGMIRKKDEIRPYALKNRDLVFKDRLQTYIEIRKIYPKPEIIQIHFDADAFRHMEAANKAGSPAIKNPQTQKPQLVDGKPIVRLATQFQNELDLELAAAEIGVPVSEFLKAIDQERRLVQQLGLLKIGGKKIKRDTFVAAIPTLIETLGLGEYVPPVDSPVTPILTTTTYENTVGITLKRIEPGTFQMGFTPEEGRRFGKVDKFDFYVNSAPRHQVEITRAFYIGITEVTQAQYKAVTNKNPSKFKGDLLPVDSITWNDAVEFCKKLSQNESQFYRLPTEAEWEYACRAGSSGLWHFGDNVSDLPIYGWTEDNSDNKTHPVGQKKGNNWGLFDMHGNLWEWCADYFSEDYYSKSPSADPQGPAAKQYHVMRGGNYSAGIPRHFSASRSRNTAFRLDHTNGFRIVLELEEKPQAATDSEP